MRVHTLMGRGFSGNIYLVDAEKPCLIDTGWEPEVGIAARRVAGILGERKLEKIILTHRHIDHVGGAMSFQRAFGGEIMAHELDAPALRAGDQDSTGARMFGGEIEPMPVSELRDGDTIDLGGGDSLAVIHTPGHTSGGICLLGSGSLFSGDTVFADGGVGRWDFETGNYDQLLASVEKLTGIECADLCPGHGPVVDGLASQHIEMSLRNLRLIGRYG